MALLFGNGSAFELCPLDDDDLCALPIGTKFSIRSDCTVFTKTTSLSKAIKREPGVAFGLWMDRSHLFGNESATISPQNLRLAFDQGVFRVFGIETAASGKIHRQNVFHT